MDLISILTGTASAIGKAGAVIDEFITTPEEKREFKLELEKAKRDHYLGLAKLETKLNLAQLKINQAEAKHINLFVAGWRPALGWICLFSLGYGALLYPILAYFFPQLQPPPSEIMLNLLLGLLGMGGLRTFEKLKNIQNRH